LDIFHHSLFPLVQIWETNNSTTCLAPKMSGYQTAVGSSWTGATRQLPMEWKI
jgi:hypothetical protein